MNTIVAELLAGEGREAGQADIILEAATWAAASFAKFRHDQVAAILRAAAPAASSDEDFCSPRTVAGETSVDVPRPVGVVFASISPADPVVAIVATLRAALATRNAIVIALEPGAPAASIEAARGIAVAAEQAGAPACAIQVIEAPLPGLARHLAQSAKVNRVVGASGGQGGVRPETLVTWTRMDADAADRLSAASQPVLGREAPMSLGRLQEGV